MQQRLSSHLPRAFGNGSPLTEPTAQTDWMPAVDITEDDQHFQIQVDLPEVKKEDVNVSVDKGILTISGERKHEFEEKGKKVHRKERSWGRYMRSFHLPEGVKDEQVEAKFQDGVLTVSLPKSEETKAKQRKIEIQG